MRRGDLVLYRTALRQRWPIPEELRAKIIIEAAKLALDPEVEDRVRLGAMKVFAAYDALNLQQENIDEARAERMALEAAQGEHDGDSGTAEGAAPAGDSDPPPPAP